MDYLLRGLEERFKNYAPLIEQIRKADIRIATDINSWPPGADWRYIYIKDGGIEERDLFSYQKEEFLNAKIYIVERSYQSQEAAQLLDKNSGLFPIGRMIKDLLEEDWYRQFALQGFYLGAWPLQINKISVASETETFTPKGVPGGSKSDRITSRLLITARYYRYSIIREAIA